MKPIQLVAAFLILIASMHVRDSSTAQAGHCKLFDQTGCACCPVCDHVCKLDAEESETERTCFEIETKVICIPRVVFPWQKSKKAACASCDSCSGRGCSSCIHNGARVRKVCVAKPTKYTCPSCKYSWSAEKVGNCCGGCTGGPACDGGCVCDQVPPDTFLGSASPEQKPTEQKASETDTRESEPTIRAAGYFVPPSFFPNTLLPTRKQ